MGAPRVSRTLRTFPGGFIQVARASLLHPALESTDPLTPREAYLSLYALAAIADTAAVRRGQVICSLRFLATRFRWSLARVQRFLRRVSSPVSGAPALLAVDYHEGEDRTVITVLEALHSRLQADTPTDTPSDTPSARLTVSNPDTSARALSESDTPRDTGSDTKPRRGEKEVKASVGSADRGHVQRRDDPPELLAFADAIVAELNTAQLANGRIDRDTFRPLSIHHPKTLEAALVIMHAGVTLEFAQWYVRTEGQRFCPGQFPQILSLAFLRGGLVREWKQRRQLKLPPPIADSPPASACTVPPPSAPALVPVVRDRELKPRRGGDPDKLDALLERMVQVPLTQEAR